ncbi:UPF0583 protein C15orf59-like [Silurus asotus]|uniref:Inhibitory synaptic factor 1 n=1 Tax=Silurus asotus TaxID=30991 RepID=A0AAD5FT56_SILAS|nr:UPF0583 protein C15orf59-like [Silurus asotus]
MRKTACVDERGTKCLGLRKGEDEGEAQASEREREREREEEKEKVVAQIDKLTAHIDLDTEEETEDDKQTWSTTSSERGLGIIFKVEAYSDSNGLNHLSHNFLCDSATIKVPALYRRSCGDLPALNGPTWSNASWLFGCREKMHTCDSVEHHALCCDDDDFDEETGCRRSSKFSSSDSVFSSSPLQPRLEASTPKSVHNFHLSPGLKKKVVRSCSTQTVSDKSTQTTLPHSPARQRAASEHCI